MTSPPRIDAHQHFWQLSRGDYHWLNPAMPELFRDFGPVDLAPHLRHHGIDGTILVQASPTEAETRYLLQLAQECADVCGVVGWIDFDAADAVERVAEIARHSLIVGVRPMVQDMFDDQWLSRPQLADVLEAVAAHGLTFDALVKPVHLSSLLAMVGRHPNLPVVIDHGAKPEIADAEWRDGPGCRAWLDDMAALGEIPSVCCKLSGLMTEAIGSDHLLPRFMEHLLQRFGPQRLIWGSDWPVALLAGSYEKWVTICERTLAPDVRGPIMGGNAQAFYLSRRGRRGG
ncbi:amidohydrolase family protein [soil metagenome]